MLCLASFQSRPVHKIRDDSSSDSEELTAQTPLLAVSPGVGLTVPKTTNQSPSAPPAPAPSAPAGGSTDVRAFDTMFSGGDDRTDTEEVPLGGTARTIVNEPSVINNNYYYSMRLCYRVDVTIS